MILAGPGTTLGRPSFPAHPAVRVPGTNLQPSAPFSAANSDTGVVVPARVPSLALTPPRRHVSLATSQTSPGSPSERQVINTQHSLASSSSSPSMTGASKSRSFFHRNKSSKEDGETRSSTDSKRTFSFPKFGPRGPPPPPADSDKSAFVGIATMPEDGADAMVALESLQRLDISRSEPTYWTELAKQGILSKIMDYVSLACRYIFFFLDFQLLTV
jgi:hypothetical protein